MSRYRGVQCTGYKVRRNRSRQAAPHQDMPAENPSLSGKTIRVFQARQSESFRVSYQSRGCPPSSHACREGRPAHQSRMIRPQPTGARLSVPVRHSQGRGPRRRVRPGGLAPSCPRGHSRQESCARDAGLAHPGGLVGPPGNRREQQHNIDYSRRGIAATPRRRIARERCEQTHGAPPDPDRAPSRSPGARHGGRHAA